MLLTKEVEITVNSSDIGWYESKGYKIPKYWSKKHKSFLMKRGTKILVKTEDLTNGSHALVQVRCDYCGKILSRSYKEYIRCHDNELGDCCHSCEGVKFKRTIQEKYGVSRVFDLPEVQQKIKTANNLKYGRDWGLQSLEVREKIEKTMMDKYGVVHPLQKEEFLNKAMSTRCENMTNPTSKPQLKLSCILLQMYGNCEIEVPCDKCSLDCVILIDNQKIDVEYDGWYWHQDTNRDRRRDNFVKSKGYKILRVKGNHQDLMPTQEQIDIAISQLLNGKNYTEIIM